MALACRVCLSFTFLCILAYPRACHVEPNKTPILYMASYLGL